MLRCHADAIVWCEDGILIRGLSGSGKSTLAAAFVEEGRKNRTFSRLVADDIVMLQAKGGRVIARPHPRLAGRMERRGVGIVKVDHEPACVLRLVADLGLAPSRMPEPETLSVNLVGITLPRIVLAQDAPAADNVYRTLELLAAFRACS